MIYFYYYMIIALIVFIICYFRFYINVVNTYGGDRALEIINTSGFNGFGDFMFCLILSALMWVIVIPVTIITLYFKEDK